MKLLGLDPGGTTGFAFCEFSGDRASIKWLEIGEVSGSDLGLWLRRSVPLVDVVVCEDFVIRPYVKKWESTTTRSNDAGTAKLVGKVQLACEWLKKPLFMYLPSDKRVGYNTLGLTYVQGKKNMHRQDAMSHVSFHIHKVYKV